ncbi:MAG TPA: branched-chain amino acid ABC transporter permease [Candidatus Bathyarchaeia archaeon]|nr:branched-chain amino acid ABC transporter permease [Candidatus Bathyarchaeia archaeon]
MVSKLSRILVPIEVAICIIALAALLAAPAYLNNLSLLFFILMWITLAQSFNMFAGLTGYVNFGHVVFYAIGAYVSALSMAYQQMPPYVAVLLAGLASAVLALGISAPTLRLRGAYFAIATLSINQAFYVFFDNWEAVGSAPGFTIPISYYQPVNEYYVMLAVATAAVVSFYAMPRSRLGVALKAIKQQEDTALSVGVNSTFYKTVALVISGFFAGMAGGTAIWQITIIDPPSAFDITFTVSSISMSMLGGLGTVLGPIIGAGILYEVIDYLSTNYPSFHLIVLGAIILLVVLVMPDGLMGFLKTVSRRKLKQ